MTHNILILLTSLLLVMACNTNEEKSKIFKSIAGQTMGTSYHISYESDKNEHLKIEVDSILENINQAVSTYIPNSNISIVNNDSLSEYHHTEMNDSLLNYSQLANKHFIENFRLSKQVHKSTNGFFDPSVMPLVNYWGFGYKAKKAVSKIDSNRVQELVDLCDFFKWNLEIANDSMKVSKIKNAEIDFSAIAKGYAVDYLATFFVNKEINNFMIEIGGEVYCSGMNSKSQDWTIGLSKPEIAAPLRDLQSLISLKNKAMASSGNYRNYYDVDGNIYGHEINPNTGYPEVNTLLGVTTISDSCSIADGLATAFMVMGLERTKNWLSNNKHIDAVLFYRNNDNQIVHYETEGIKGKLKELK